MTLSSYFYADKYFYLFQSNNVYYKLFVCTQFNVFTYCYASVTTQTSVILYTQLNDQTVLFQTIQFSKNTQFKYQTVLFHP